MIVEGITGWTGGGKRDRDPVRGAPVRVAIVGSGRSGRKSEGYYRLFSTRCRAGNRELSEH